MADAVKAAGGGRRYRVGLVGAGAISDFHAAAVRRAPEAVLVGLYVPTRSGERGRPAP